MLSRRTTGVLAVVATVLIAISYVALIGVETSAMFDHLAYFQRGEQLASSAILARSSRSSNSSANDSSNTSVSNAISEGVAATDALRPNDTDDVDDELLTPEFVQQIRQQQTNPLAPIQVHLLWIGDVSKAPKEHVKYAERGFNLTVHTDAEEILAGFQPFVLRAYRLALPRVVGFDFLKFALLYKYGGLAVDADTTPSIAASELQFPSGCDVVFSKEATPPANWEKPVFRQTGGPDYGLIRPFQILNWAMAAAAPRNKHIKWLMRAAMARFFGLRDMEATLIQDISGSGLMTDYVALLHEQQGRSYRDVYTDRSKYIPVDGLCLTDRHLQGMWIWHSFHGSWKHLDSK